MLQSSDAAMSQPSDLSGHAEAEETKSPTTALNLDFD